MNCYLPHDSCNHSEGTTTYAFKNDTEHNVIFSCICGYEKVTQRNHSYVVDGGNYAEDNGYCTVCKSSCTHEDYLVGVCANCGKPAA